jgi:hypothetical protein
MRTYEDLSGRFLKTKTGYLEVLGRVAGSKPLRWSIRCTNCDRRWEEGHVMLRQGEPRCKNELVCGRVPTSRSGTSGVVETIGIPTLTRTRDSNEVAEHEAGLRAAEQMINERARFDKYHSVATTVWGFQGPHVLSWESWNLVSQEKRDEIAVAIEREQGH